MEKIGLIPAAGKASRLGLLPCSKELLPVDCTGGKNGGVLKVVSNYLLEKYHRAGIRKVYTIIRKGKWDIPDYYGDGTRLGLDMAYLIMKHPYGVPYSLDQAYPFTNEAMVFFGFPDILFEPEDAFSICNALLIQRNADIFLGLFDVREEYRKSSCDMVRLNSGSRIRKILVKPRATNLSHSWVFAVWNPGFSCFMHDFLKDDLERRQNSTYMKELHLGHVIQSAIENDMRVYGHVFEGFEFLDVGSAGNLAQALQKNRIPT